MRCALITGLSGETPTPAERDFLARRRPCGIILFARNCRSPDQMRALVSAVQDALATADVLVLIDQEGGRVRRLKPPHWRPLPAAAAYGPFYAANPARALALARLAARLTAQDLRAVGINTNCAPVLDMPVPGAHNIIGDRAYGRSVEQIAALGRAVAEGFMAGGVAPVIKHIPGHGRALADSHWELPVVSTEREELSLTDFAAFHALRDMPAAMTAHVVFSALDPHAPASTSAVVTRSVIRGEIGFGGLLMCDDLGMGALSGDAGARAADVIAAGSDVVLYCSAAPAEMEAVAERVPPLTGEGLARFQRCLAVSARSAAFDRAAAESALAEVLAGSNAV